MDWRKYVYSFVITAVIFATAILVSNYFSQKRINEIKDIETSISIDISASETQYSLLSELSCKEISSSLLSKEMADLGNRLSYMEQSRGSDNEEVITLKKYYSMLEIKDFLLSQKIKERCGTTQKTSAPSIIYFYSNEGDCSDCQKEGFVLTKLQQDYPELRVYSFDYNLNLSALETLVSIYGIKNDMPALLIDEKVYYGFKSVDDLKEVVPALKELDKQKAAEAAAKEATSTKK